MVDVTGTAVFFDIGNTLVSVAVAAGGHHIDRLSVYPYVAEVLGQLRDDGARLGIVSDPGGIPVEDVNRALADAGLWDFFDPALVIYGPKDSARVFEQAAGQAGAPGRLLFVGEDPRERALALQAGFLVAPHPLLAVPVLEGASLRYARIRVPRGHAGEDWRAGLRELALLPVHVTGENGTTVYAITTTPTVARLDDLGFWVDRLGAEGEPLTTDLYLLRDDRQAASGFLTSDGNSSSFFRATPESHGVLASTDEGLIVAVAGGTSVEDYHFRDAQHGHNLKLVPTPLPGDRVPAAHAAPVAETAPTTLTADERRILDATIHAPRLTGHVERYTGICPADAATVITSRHIHHADNAAAVTALVGDLERIGQGRFLVHRHRFTHEGRPLENVEAELPGDGLDGVVLVTAHLDSTGARDPRYRPATDRAPGADDDASGTAGVLAAAEAFLALDAALQLPRRSVRFVLFNAEEHGLVGSNDYARDQRLLGIPIVAVLQMDMIGYDVRPEPAFELHAGISAWPDVQARSLELAQMIAQLVPEVSPDLPSPQIYPHPGQWDPAEGRSDHYSFQAQGYTACLASEDLFVGPGTGAPPEEMNPNYHLPTDTAINPDYAADIARLIAAAAWVATTR